MMGLAISRVKKYLIKKNLFKNIEVSFAIIKPLYLKSGCTVKLLMK